MDISSKYKTECSTKRLRFLVILSHKSLNVIVDDRHYRRLSFCYVLPDFPVAKLTDVHSKFFDANACLDGHSRGEISIIADYNSLLR